MFNKYFSAFKLFFFIKILNFFIDFYFFEKAKDFMHLSKFNVSNLLKFYNKNNFRIFVLI